MSRSQIIIDEVPDSRHTLVRMSRDFITYVDGSAITGEQYIRAFIRVGEYNGTAVCLSELNRQQKGDTIVWKRPGSSTIIYVEIGLPERYRSTWTVERLGIRRIHQVD